ncbi:Hypothetical predicted protein [Scomber scombrus]|uniref:Uncharacterized protein n=1 Tax=Scomber scombrus TaxID=13677 RepID=A0AAV1MUT3_SCOSC
MRRINPGGLYAYTNWKSNNFQSIQTVSPDSSPSQTQGWPNNSQHTESLSSLLVYTSESNEALLLLLLLLLLIASPEPRKAGHSFPHLSGPCTSPFP